MTSPQPWFLGHMLSDPVCIRHAIFVSVGFFGLIGIFGMMLRVCGRFDDAICDLEELLEPATMFHFSPHGELRAYDGCVEILRGGACVGILRAGVASVSWSGARDGRVMEARYPDGRLSRISCGTVNWQEAVRVKELVMRYAGRKRYG